MQRYTASLSVVDGERTAANNMLTFYTDIIDSRRKVAIIGNAPHPDLAALKQAVESNPNYEAEVFLNEELKMRNEELDLDGRVERAVENFMQGYGCCQSIVAAFADLYGMDDTMAKRIAAGFGGGVGRMRMMCGAVSGIVMLVGLDCGQTEGSDREGKSACYKVVQELLARSQAENGSLICAEILGLKGHEKAQNSYVASARTAEYYKTRPCAAKVESAARIFADYLKSKR